MKLLFIFLPLFVYAQSYLVSKLPLPKTYIQNLDIETCNNKCLEEYLIYGEIFSFLAHAPDTLDDASLNESRLIHTTLLNLGALNYSNRSLRIALLLPHKQIGRYAYSTSNAVFAYLLSQNIDYELKSFQIENESSQAIAQALNKIILQGYDYLIAPLTIQGSQNLIKQTQDLTVYIPTVNKSDLNITQSDIYFGGIDYKAQIDKLMSYSCDPLVVYYDQSTLGETLKEKTRDAYLLHEGESLTKHIYSYGIDQRTSNLKKQLHENKKIDFGTFFLNTPIVKSSMIMSQITLYDVNTTNILSTQINYDPLIFSITQAKDRKNMIIANSINIENNVMIEANNLLNNDISYDWINYATTVGIDYFYYLASENKREYPLDMIDKQIEYPITLVEPGFSKFLLVDEGL
ncbi:MAG: hypothetical protein U9R50_06895 [Campylobacterota bacterium]|nr:hypothetical protein [Campylobacterota bacterium]